VKTSIKKEVEVEAKTLHISLKVVDGFGATLTDQDGAVLADYEGYVPDFMPGEHYGDYVMLDVDIDTGKITNWKTPTDAQLKSFMGADDGEE
jgi:hypothetical protein